MSTYVMQLTDERATLARVGGKGISLTRMIRAGLPVPDGFHVTTDAYRAFVQANNLQLQIGAALDRADPNQPESLESVSRTIRDLFEAATMPAEIATAVAQAYSDIEGQSPAVAVRSSATAEDLPDASFAGQQETFLNVHGKEAVCEAVKRCWGSLWTARAIGYRSRQQIPSGDLSLAVVVQHMVPANAAGVMFTANPANGRRDQVVINAAWGLGESVVSGEVTPDTYFAIKATGEVCERQIADKRVMTVRTETGTRIESVPEALRNTAVLDDAQIATLVQLGDRIEMLYGDPRDIEWACVDGTFAILQARAITALPAPMSAPPEEWPLPDPKGYYTRTSIVDFMPDPLTPLFASMLLPAIDDSIKKTMIELIRTSKAPSLLDDYLVTINDYAYLSFRLSTAYDYWWLIRMLAAFPRLLSQAVPHWRDVARPAYAAAVAQWKDRAVESMTAVELLNGAAALTGAMTRYLTRLQVDSLGVAAGSEALFTNVYQKLIRRGADTTTPPAPAFLLGSNSLAIQAEKALYEMALWCREYDDLVRHLVTTSIPDLIGQLDKDTTPPGISPASWEAWRERFRAYLDQYGHCIYDLDFAKPVPAHDPVPPLQTLKVFVRGEGRDPRARQQQSLAEREAAVAAVRKRTKGLKRKIFEMTLGWAQTFSYVREDSIFDIGLAYPTLRNLLLELGRRMVAAGALMDPDDIFWLEQDEASVAAEALDQGAALDPLSDLVEARKMRWRAEKHVTPPGQLPKKERVMGIKTELYIPVDAGEQEGSVLKGIGASPGQVTGIARVLEGPEDFNQMQHGDILVADVTTPAWTPLFALASGIVTNVGGPLSHGSIVAREYGIPAVLGTGVATKRIRSGMTVTVDGDMGQVMLRNKDHEDAA